MCAEMEENFHQFHYHPAIIILSCEYDDVPTHFQYVCAVHVHPGCLKGSSSRTQLE